MQKFLQLTPIGNFELMNPIRSILLVDDDQDDQFVFAECLSGISKEIILETANDGIDALEKLKAAERKPDLIFIDLNMPRMNGKTLLRELKSTATLSQVPVIVYSTSSSPEDLRDTKSLGAQQFITKPHSFDELSGVLANLLSNRMQAPKL